MAYFGVVSVLSRIVTVMTPQTLPDYHRQQSSPGGVIRERYVRSCRYIAAWTVMRGTARQN